MKKNEFWHKKLESELNADVYSLSIDTTSLINLNHFILTNDLGNKKTKHAKFSEKTNISLLPETHM